MMSEDAAMTFFHYYAYAHFHYDAAMPRCQSEKEAEENERRVRYADAAMREKDDILRCFILFDERLRIIKSAALMMMFICFRL